MIKINLLPPYVFERQVVQRLMILFGVGLGIIVAAGMGLKIQRGAVLVDLQQQLAASQIIENEVKSNESQAAAELAKIGPIEGKVKFIEDVMAYNLKGPALYEQLTRFTYEKVRYRSISINDAGNQMEIEAYAPSLSDAGRYLLNLYRATDLFSQVSMSAVPGYAKGDSSGVSANPAYIARGARVLPKRVNGFDFKVTCTLTQPLVPPAYGGATAAPSAAAGMPGAPAGAPPGAYTPSQPTTTATPTQPASPGIRGN